MMAEWGQKATSTKGSLPALERRHANVLQKLTVLDTARPDDDLLRDDQAEQYVEEREQPRDGLHQVVPDHVGEGVDRDRQ